jgi:hypothetical protein
LACGGGRAKLHSVIIRDCELGLFNNRLGEMQD